MPFIAQTHTADSLNIDLIKGSRKRIEPSGIHDHVELECIFTGFDARRCNTHDGSSRTIHQRYGVAVIGFEVACLHGHPLNAKTVIFWNQQFSDSRVVDTLANAVSDVVRKFRIGFFIEKNVREILQPNTETRLVV